MTEVILTEHVWVGAAYVTLATGQAKHAARRGSIRVPAETRVDVLEVYCHTCRKPFTDCIGEDGKPGQCEITHHLRGGPIGERRKRKGIGDPLDELILVDA
jgi:hypothetical protein